MMADKLKSLMSPAPRAARSIIPSSAPVSPRAKPKRPPPLTFTALSNLAVAEEQPAVDKALDEFLISTPCHTPPDLHLDSVYHTPEEENPPAIKVTDTECPQCPLCPLVSPTPKAAASPPLTPKSHQVRSVSPLLSRKASRSRKPGRYPSLSEEQHLEERFPFCMLYNEYNELLTREDAEKTIALEDLTVTQALRLIYKNHHFDFKNKMREVLSPLLAGGLPASLSGDSDILTDRLASWIFSPSVDTSRKQAQMDTVSPEEGKPHAIPVYSGPPRVLQVGCADGKWCEGVKRVSPDWVIEGVDDVARWSSGLAGNTPRDFMEPLQTQAENDYFSNVHPTQGGPEFTCRDLNDLLSHEKPIPQNLYSLIRGRDVFDRIHSYKDFLEDIRNLLRPCGVVEFIEIDPRPRCRFIRRRHSMSEHRSGPETDWTDKIADRFKDPYDEQLANNVPEWTARVEERLKATLRPRDGIPAAKLKGWLQGAGFWDAKQAIIRLPVGGETPHGRKLAKLVLQEIEIEDSMPVLAENLPKINPEHINMGHIYFNLHVVTGKKPKYPRPGDLLADGSRQDMNAAMWQKLADRKMAERHASDKAKSRL